MPLYFSLIGTIADVDETILDSSLHPSPVLLLDTAERIERVVLSPGAWTGPRELLQVGRRLRVTGECEFPANPVALPVAFHVDFVDVH